MLTSRKKENVALLDEKDIKRKEKQTDRQHANRKSPTSNDMSVS